MLHVRIAGDRSISGVMVVLSIVVSAALPENQQPGMYELPRLGLGFVHPRYQVFYIFITASLRGSPSRLIRDKTVSDLGVLMYRTTLPIAGL